MAEEGSLRRKSPLQRINVFVLTKELLKRTLGSQILSIHPTNLSAPATSLLALVTVASRVHKMLSKDYSPLDLLTP
jgi:hypothetical protein